MEFSRREFLSGAVASTIAAAMVSPHHWLQTQFPASFAQTPWRPSSDEIAAWLANYKVRNARAHALAEAVQGCYTQTLRETREWVERWEQFEQVRGEWGAHRAMVAVQQGRGYCDALDDNPPREDLKADDQGYSYFNGYQLGTVDREFRAAKLARLARAV